MGAYLCTVPFISVLNFCMALSQFCPRLQFLVDSVPCFMALFQGYLPLQNLWSYTFWTGGIQSSRSLAILVIRQWCWVPKMGDIYYCKIWRYYLGLPRTQRQEEGVWTSHCQMSLSLYSFQELSSLLASQRGRQMQVAHLNFLVLVS
jgi:hypothetical protein